MICNQFIYSKGDKVMKQIRVKNLRSLEDSGNIVVKPLTVLLGKNSVGKSTFLRMFPLFKQSLGIDRSEPLLWYSPELVDFGSFKESVYNNEIDKEIEFSFDFLVDERNFMAAMLFSTKFDYDFPISIKINSQKRMFYDINLSLGVQDKRVSSIKFSIFDYFYEIIINPDNEISSFLINGIPNPINKKFDKANNYLARKILPSINIAIDTKSFQKNISIKKIKRYEDEINDLIEIEFSKIKNGRVSNDAIKNIVKSLGYAYGPKNEFRERFMYEISKLKTIKGKFQKLGDKKEEFFDCIYILYGFKHVNLFMDVINSYLFDYFENVQYIAPIRATAQRYYRIQGLSMNDITPQGENVPMVLNNMNLDEKQKWNAWTKEKFNIEFDVIENEANLSIKLIKNGHEINLADTGFGYSQLLPILLYIWRTPNLTDDSLDTYPGFGNKIKTLVIEQPELHLHPALQSKLMDIFIDVVSKLNDMNFNILMETHSEEMVNRIGQHIVNSSLTNDSVNILLFNENNKENIILQTKFSNQGYLENWPIDFFMSDSIDEDFI